MSIELMQEIADNYQMAKLVHESCADLCWFIYAPGYAMLHEYQLISESCTLRKIKRYITSTYHMYIPDKIPKTANITEPLIGDRNRKTLKKQDVWKIIQEMWKTHMKWEEDALKLYQQVSADLFSKGEISAFNFVSNEIINHVKAELVFVTDKVIELESHGWDMSVIMPEQTNYLERYERLISELFGKSNYFHHHNSALDPASRVLFENTPAE